MGPMVTGQQDARAFAAELVANPRLWRLARSFDDSPAGLPARIDYLRRIAAELPPQDQQQAVLILEGWQSADALPGMPEDADLGARVLWLREFARQRFDFRWGKERSFIPTTQELLEPAVAELVYGIADDWGMSSPNEAAGDYDLVVVLGGLIRANVNRSALAAQLLGDALVKAPKVAALAGSRQLGPGEIELARQIGCPVDTEEESLAWGMARAFGTSASSWTSSSPGIDALSDTGDRVVMCGTAPTPGTGGRADTQTAFQWLLGAVPGITTSTSRVLCVTSAIYWIDGHIRLLTQLPVGCELVTTGTAGVNADPLLAQTYLSQQYLQEVKSAINALPGLLAWAGD